MVLWQNIRIYSNFQCLLSYCLPGIKKAILTFDEHILRNHFVTGTKIPFLESIYYFVLNLLPLITTLLVDSSTVHSVLCHTGATGFSNMSI